MTQKNILIKKTSTSQGFNRIAAIALLFLNEEDAFWLLVYIVDVVMPVNYYTKQLIGAQVDQAVFKELVTEKLPNLAEHLGKVYFYFENVYQIIFQMFMGLILHCFP